MENRTMISKETSRKVVLWLGLIGGLTLNVLPGRAQEVQAAGLPKNKVVATVKVSQPSAIAVSPDSTTVYLINGIGSVLVLDATNKYKVKKAIQYINAFDLALSP